MNNDIRNEMIIVMNSEGVCDDCQIRILRHATRFLDNIAYMEKIKENLDCFFDGREPTDEFNFWIELPKMVSLVIEINKTVLGSSEIDIDYMKFVLYSIIYSYLNEHHADVLNRQNPGDFRICFLNVLAILLTKPKHIKIQKESLFNMIWSCVCGDDNIRV